MVRILWLAGLFAAVTTASPNDSGLEIRSVTVASSGTASNGGNGTDSVAPFNEDKKIDTVVAVATVAGTFGTAILAGNAATDLYEFIASKITKKSEDNSCTLTYGSDSDDGVNTSYAYFATTTGSNCDTTAIKNTILAAVDDCANTLHSANALAGCCRFSHGGTWTGYLRLSTNSSKYPAENVQCNF